MDVVIDKIRKNLRMLASPFWVVRGRERHCGKALSVLWSGSENHLAYLVGRLFEPDSSSAQYLGRRPMFLANYLLSRHDCSMGVFLTSHESASMLMGKTDLRMPLWNECEVNLDAKRSFAQARDLQRDLKKSQEHGISGKISTRPSDVEKFFEDIYLPSVNISHGAAALPTSCKKRVSQLIEGKAELVQMLHEGIVVAGLLIDYRNETPALKEIGLLDGSKALRKVGAIAATNIFTMDYLKSKGFPRVNFGFSRCYLNDGGLAYKKKYRPVITGASPECLFFRFRRMDDATRSLLRSEPCISWQGETLARTYFREAAGPATDQVKRAPRSEWAYGLQSEAIYRITDDGIEPVNSKASQVLA